MIFFISPSLSSEACIATYVRIPYHKYEYVYIQLKILLERAPCSVLHVASYWCLITSPPEGVARYCFHPVCLSVCLCVCVSVCLCMCPANILVFYFSAIRRDIDLKFIHDTYGVALNSLKNNLTFICQRSRSQGRYIAFWRYSHITKIER